MRHKLFLFLAFLCAFAGTTWGTESKLVTFMGFSQTSGNTSHYIWTISGFLGQFSTQSQSGTSKTFSNQTINLEGSNSVTINGTFNFANSSSPTDITTGSQVTLAFYCSHYWFYGATVMTSNNFSVPGYNYSVSNDKHTVTVTIPLGTTFGNVYLEFVPNEPITNSNTTVSVPAGDYWVSDASHRPQPAPTVIYRNSTTLTQGTDYTLSWSNNSSAGTGTVTVTGTGAYAGTATANFSIRWATYTVHFNKNHNDATGTMEDMDFTYGTAQNLTANGFTAPTGYHFTGWNTKADGSGMSYADGASVTNLSAEDGTTVNLYAQWEINTYSVKFDKWGGNGAMNDQPFTYGEEKPLATCTFTRTGYTFAGWSTTSGGNVAYTDGQSVSNLTNKNGATVTLYARWTGNSYTVRFHANGGKGEMADQGFTYGNSQNLTANAFTMTGHCFYEWNTQADGSGTSYIDKHNVKNLTATDGGVFDLYAQWIDAPTYIDAAGTEKTADKVTFITSNKKDYGNSSNDEAWYAVRGEVTISGQLSFSDKSVHLILYDGASLNFTNDNNYLISSKEGALSIYGQTLQSGRIEATTTDNKYAIYSNGGDITINGGTINATSSGNAIYISRGNLIINRGNITAKSNGWSSITANCYDSVGGDITINGGTVTIFGDVLADGNVTINGGTVTLEKAVQAEGDFTINGGIVNINDISYLFDDDSTQPDGYKNADHIAALADDNTHNITLYGRTLYKDGKWNTLCLPFNVMLASSYLKGATLMELDTENKWKIDNGEWTIDNVNGTSQTGFDSETGTLYLNFKTAENIEAGKPYIIKWADGSNITKITFYGVTVSNANADVDFTGGYFRGTYSKITYDEENRSILFMGANNTLFYPSNGASIGAFRAYFQLTDPSATIKEFNLNFGEEDDATGILNSQFSILNSSEADAWYTLDGRKINNSQLSILNYQLPKGIYIVNGRKVLK